ncbi:MAG: helix-turn-helix domain-containing protein [Clostridiales bacterium]|jgi:IS30 family transposase|nr:helix-turn-helix domain-containing protein [Clostridiales bacterium]
MPYHHLTRTERGKIALFRNQKLKIREIARRLGRSPATISRELKRNSDASYRADDAQKKYQKRRENSRRKRLFEDAAVCGFATENLLKRWSSEQISGRLRLEKRGFTVLFSSIYHWLADGLLPRSVELKANLRRSANAESRRK